MPVDFMQVDACPRCYRGFPDAEPGEDSSTCPVCKGRPVRCIVLWNADVDAIKASREGGPPASREGGVGPERDALSLSLLAVDLWHEQFLPVVRAGDVARSQLRRQAVSVIVEQKQRVVADRLEMSVVGAAFLLSAHWTLARIHVEYRMALTSPGIAGDSCSSISSIRTISSDSGRSQANCGSLRIACSSLASASVERDGACVPT